MAARLGVQIEFVAKTLVSRAPSRASRSRLGVAISEPLPCDRSIHKPPPSSAASNATHARRPRADVVGSGVESRSTGCGVIAVIGTAGT